MSADRHGRTTLNNRQALVLLGAIFAVAALLEWMW